MNIYLLKSLNHSTHKESNESENEKIYFLKEEKKKLEALKIKFQEESESLENYDLEKKAA